MVKTAKVTDSEELIKEPVDNTPGSSAEAGSSYVPALENLSLNAYRAQLMTNGKLKPKTQIGLIKKLRQMMLDDEDGTAEWLRAIVTLPGWNKNDLIEFLTDDRVQDTPDEERTSLLRASIPHFLSILLSLDDSIVQPLILNLINVAEDNIKTGLQVLIEQSQYSLLESVFTALRRCPNKNIIRPDLSKTFKDASFEKLLAFAKAKGQSFYGFQFHQLVGTDRLSALSEQEMLVLIGTLLTQSASSEGMALYHWYVSTKQVDPNFHLAVINSQRTQFANHQLDSQFLNDFFDNRNILTPDSVTRSIIADLTELEFFRFVQLYFTKWLEKHKLVRPENHISLIAENAPSYWNAQSLQLLSSRHIAENQLLAILSARPAATSNLLNVVDIKPENKAYFARMLMLVSNDNIPRVTNYYRQSVPVSHQLAFISDLMFFFNNNRETSRLLIDNLTSDEIISLLHARMNLRNPSTNMISPEDLLKYVTPGKLPFNSIVNLIHAKSRTNFNNYYHTWQASNDLISFIPKTSTSNLGYELVLYRALRDHNPNQRESFWGIEGGYSKNEKFAVVHKLLIHIYGTEEEKQAEGAFSAEDIKILNQGKLGRVASRYSREIGGIIARAGEMASLKPSAPPEPSSSFMLS